MHTMLLTLSGRARDTFETTAGGLPRTYWVLWFGMLLNRLGGLVQPFFALYLTQHRGMSVERAGLVLMLHGAGSVAGNLLGGIIADRIGRRTAMLAGLFASALAMLAVGSARDLPSLAISVLALGVTADAYRPALHAATADVVAPQDRARAFGLLYWASNLAFSVAPIVGGLLAAQSFQTLFLVDAATTAAFGLFVLVAVPETQGRAVRPPPREPLRRQLAAFTDRTFLRFLLLSIGFAVILNQYSATLPLTMQRAGLSAADCGRVLAVNGLLIILVQIWLTARAARCRRGSVLAAGCLLLGLGFGMNALVHERAGFALSVAIWTFGELLVSPANASVVADLAPDDMRGRYQGAFSMAMGLATLLAPALGTRVLVAGGGAWLWGGCAALGALLATGHLLAARSRQIRMIQLLGTGHAWRD